MNSKLSLSQLGWNAFFQQQLSLDDLEISTFGRVLEQHQTHYLIQTENEQLAVQIDPNIPQLTVGDWVLIDADKQFVRALERLTLLSQTLPESKAEKQFVAANVNTLFIVSALNQNFNLSQIEAYLALAHDSGCEPVVVLTQQDSCENVDDYVQQVSTLGRFLMVETVNSLDLESVSKLHSWCKKGQTVAFVGATGMGKSTLVKTLMQAQLVTTDVATTRALFVMPTGGVLLDTPEIRELQVAGPELDVNEEFSDISELAEKCRFGDCQHQGEPGCAVQKALDKGTIDERRFNSYLAMLNEQKRNDDTLAQSRSADKSITKNYKQSQNLTRLNKHSGY